MMRRRIKLWVLAVSLLFVNGLCLSAQTIFSHLEEKDNTTKAEVKVYQDKRIESLVYGIKKKNEVATPKTEAPVLQETDNSKEIAGYRVQIYSSNMQKTAKTEAFRIEEEFQQLLPETPVYVFYHSPFWKVRAGNCRTMEEAQQLRSEIGAAYPELKKDLYVVRDRIKVSAQ